jgi:hypothetical protein
MFAVILASRSLERPTSSGLARGMSPATDILTKISQQ